jgi:GT2 family glycosyltransferase
MGSKVNFLKAGNSAYKIGEYEKALVSYIMGFVNYPEFRASLYANVQVTQSKILKDRKNSLLILNLDKKSGKNGSFQSYNDELKSIYSIEDVVEFDLNLFNQFLDENRLGLDDELKFSSSPVFKNALRFVLLNPIKLVHIRASVEYSIYFSLLYKVIWDSYVVLDVYDLKDLKLLDFSAKTLVDLSSFSFVDAVKTRNGGSEFIINTSRKSFYSDGFFNSDIKLKFFNFEYCNDDINGNYISESKCLNEGYNFSIACKNFSELFDDSDGILYSFALLYVRSLFARSIKRNLLSKNKIVVYTAVANGYDVLRDPLYVIPGADYVAFTNTKFDCKIWKLVSFNYFEEDLARSARFVKIHPHFYFHDYDISIWIDANISFVKYPKRYLKILENSYIGMFPHPHRDCVYDEANACKERLKDSHTDIDNQVVKYKKLNFPRSFGLWETGIIFRRHNNSECISLMTKWWQELFSGSKRDQISLPISLYETNTSIDNLEVVGTDLRFHELISYVKHNKSNSEIFDKYQYKPFELKGKDTCSVDIGICVYNSLEVVIPCIDSALKTRGLDDWIIIVDDASEENTESVLLKYSQENARIKYIRHKENKGYTISANDVIKNSTGDYVVLLNSDTVLAKNTIKRLVEAGEKYPRLGIIGPLSNAAGWQSIPDLFGEDGRFITNEIPKNFNVDMMEEFCSQLYNSSVPFVPLVNGFCFAIKRDVINRIGYFDVDSFPIGYGEEDDFCLRAGNEGFICGIATNTYVYHVKSVTFTTERRKLIAKNAGKVLRAKHNEGRVNKSTMIAQYHPELVRIRQLVKNIYKKYGA